MSKYQFIFCNRLFKGFMIASCVAGVVACAALVPSAMDKEQAYNERVRALRCQNYDMPKAYCAELKLSEVGA